MKTSKEQLVTIATFSQVIEAQLAKTRLEADSIEVFISNENIVSMNWLLSGAVGGAKLLVRKEDEDRAKEILNENYKGELTENEYDIIKCPQCGSENTSFEKFSKRIAFLSWLLLTFPIPYLKKKWRCRECGFEWKK